MDRERRNRRALVALTLVALPAALLVEQLLAHFVLPADLELVREYFAETLEPVGWSLVAATALIGIFSAFAHRRAQQHLASLPVDPARPETGARKQIGLFLWYGSLPQIPAVATAVGHLLGISLLQAILAVALSTIAIAWIGRRI